MKRILTILLLWAIIATITTIAYAAWQRIVLIDSQERAFGTTANPIYVQGV